MDDPIIVTKCRQTFQKEALELWLKRRKNCPLCKNFELVDDNPTITMNFPKEKKDLAVSEPGLPKLKLETTSKLEPNSPSLPFNTVYLMSIYYTPTHHNVN